MLPDTDCTDLTDLVDPTYEYIAPDDPDVCQHLNALWISKGNMTFEGEPDDNITHVLVCMGCGAILAKE